MTDDILLLTQLDAKIDSLVRQVVDLSLEMKELDRRFSRIERAHPGGRWAKIVERGILLALTTMLAWQNVTVSGSASQRPTIDSSVQRPTIDSSVQRPAIDSSAKRGE